MFNNIYGVIILLFSYISLFFVIINVTYNYFLSLFFAFLPIYELKARSFFTLLFLKQR